eukprot:2620652-Amphidinium_carterae.1
MAEAHYITNPVLGPIMKGTSAIAVDRQKPDSRHFANQAEVALRLRVGVPSNLSSVTSGFMKQPWKATQWKGPETVKAARDLERHCTQNNVS